MVAGHGAAADRDTRLAVVTITLTVMALSLGDALIKGMSLSLPLWQIFVLRSLVALPVLAAVMRARGARIALCAPGWSALRSVMLVAMWVLYYSALPFVPLAVAAAAYYTLPIFITIFAALLLSERTGTAAWSAVLLGFVGIVLILRPGASGFGVHALLPLGSAVLYALAMILTRTKCRQEDPLMLSLVLNVAFIGTGIAASLVGAGIDSGPGLAPTAWSPMNAERWGAVCALAAVLLVGSIGAAFAYQVGPPSTVAVFDFAYVGFAAVWGVLFFGEVPGPSTLMGMGLIVIAGMLAVRAGARPGRTERTERTGR